MYAHMAGARIYGLRLDDEMRARWEAAAEGCGMKLAEFIKRCVEDTLAGPDTIRAAPPSKRTLPSGGKVFKGPDPKPGK